MFRKLNILALLISALFSGAQMPETDLWLFQLETDKFLQTHLKKPLNFTNRPGYDNQPCFSADGKKIFYVSVRDDKQADIYFYDISGKKIVRLTKSKESEYSPQPMQGGPYLASVVVEQDSAQRIHFINNLTGADEKKFDFDSVGYYSFLNTDTLVYYKLTAPHSLHVYATGSGEDKWLGNSPTRGFKAINRHTLLFGLKDSTRVTYYKYNFLLHKAEQYAAYPSPAEDFIWHPVYGLVKSEEMKLLRYDETKKNWVLLFDLSETGVKKITRFAFDAKNKYLVVVNNP